VLDEAASLAMSFFRRRTELTIQMKGTQDLVSEADREVEALIRERLRVRFPDDGFLGEEGGLAGDAESAEGALWVVDPIDGTQPFLTGLGSWVISIAYVVGTTIELGLVSCPAREETFIGRRAAGPTTSSSMARCWRAAPSLRHHLASIPRSHRSCNMVTLARLPLARSVVAAPGCGGTAERR
jgi:myo-inositol-1(or 4)-monophosphatase